MLEPIAWGLSVVHDVASDNEARSAKRRSRPCGGSPREGARSEARAEQRLAAGGAQRSPDPDNVETLTCSPDPDTYKAGKLMPVEQMSETPSLG